jgi:hypothetical protein
MSILLLLLMIALVGVVAWALVSYVPMPAAIRTVIIVVAVMACVLYALHAMGIGLPNPSVPRLKG